MLGVRGDLDLVRGDPLGCHAPRLCVGMSAELRQNVVAPRLSANRHQFFVGPSLTPRDMPMQSHGA
jgi:hypothetical protein